MKGINDGSIICTRKNLYPMNKEGYDEYHRKSEIIEYYDEYMTKDGSTTYAINMNEDRKIIDIYKCEPTTLWIQKNPDGDGYIGVYENTNWGPIPFSLFRNMYYNKTNFKYSDLGHLLIDHLGHLIDLTIPERIMMYEPDEKQSFVPRVDVDSDNHRQVQFDKRENKDGQMSQESR